MKRTAAMAAIVLALNFIWEMAQCDRYVGMNAMPFWDATLLCLFASFGDVGIAATSFAIAALVSRDLRWPARRHPAAPLVVYLAVGIAITIVGEKTALAVGMWRYRPEMSVILGVGVLPLAQWVAVPVVGFVILRAWLHRTPSW